MGFAPMDNPKIAICVYVENAGYGAQVAVPLGAMVLERYLRGASKEIEERANKWSDNAWMNDTPKQAADPAPAQASQPATTTASNRPTRDNKPISEHQRERAIIVNPIRFISTSRYGHLKG